MKLVTPKVFLVGYTVLDWSAVNEYLRHAGCEAFLHEMAEADRGGAAEGEILCSLYAKLCYASLTKGKNRNLTRTRCIEENVKATLAAGHGCYDSDTDVLTVDGWKRWPDVSATDRLATLHKDGSLAYERPVDVRAFDYSGKMYRVECQGVDLLVTPSHNMYVCQTTTRKGRERRRFELVKAEDLGHASHAYTKVAKAWQPASPAHSRANILRFLGFAIGDGHYSGGSCVRFRLRRKRKIDWLTALAADLKKESSQWEIKFDGVDRFTVRVEDSALGLVRGIYTPNREKCIPQSALMTSSLQCLEGLLEGLMESDGHRSATGDVYDTTSDILAGQVQQLCLHLGIAANATYTYALADRPGCFSSNKSLTRLSILRRNVRPEVNRHVGQVGRSSWVENWSGQVYCAQMPDDTRRVVYVRRNGKPVWCGNSVFEHVNLNFVAADVSRVCSHELVRHRVGTAYSQESGRYVRADEVRFVHDPILDGVKHVIEETLAYVEGQYKFMGELMGIDELTDFDQKKKLTSALRRILPNGQANEVGFSMNLRALRHTIQMRTSRHAEAEIREVFAQVYRLVKAKYPLIFSDAKEEVVGGVIEVSGMKTQPY